MVNTDTTKWIADGIEGHLRRRAEGFDEIAALQAEAFLDKLPQDDPAIFETFDAFVSRQTGIVDWIVPNERNST